MTCTAQPLISVCLPVFNAETFLSEAIDSILLQTYQNFELLIMDDGSTDNSPEILDRYRKQDCRIRLFRQSNNGLVSSLNRLMQEARGPYLARMDADDVAHPHRFALQVAELEARPDLGVLGGSIVTINEKGEQTQRIDYPRGNDILAYSRYASPVAHPAVMMRAELAGKAGGYRAYYRHCEDYDLWLRMLSITVIDNLADIVLFYRTHEKNISIKHAFDQRLGTCIAQAVHRHREKTGKDLTPDLPPPSFEALDMIPLGASERAEFWVDMLPTLTCPPAVVDFNRIDQLLRLCRISGGRKHRERLYRLCRSLFWFYKGKYPCHAALMLLRMVYYDPRIFLKTLLRKIT